MTLAHAAIQTTSTTPPSVLRTLAGELVSLLDIFIEGLGPVPPDALRQLAIVRAEIASELLPGLEVDRHSLNAECLDLALLLASKSFAEMGNLRIQTMLLATSLAGAG